MMILTGRLPIRLSDELRIEIDPGAASFLLTPAQAIGLGRRLIEQGVARKLAAKRTLAARPKPEALR